MWKKDPIEFKKQEDKPKAQCSRCSDDDGGRRWCEAGRNTDRVRRRDRTSSVALLGVAMAELRGYLSNTMSFAIPAGNGVVGGSNFAGSGVVGGPNARLRIPGMVPVCGTGPDFRSY